VNLTCTTDARTTHATGDNRCVTGHAATAGHHAFGNSHAADVFRAGFCTNQNDILALGRHLLGFVCSKINLTAGSTGGCIQAAGQFIQGIVPDVFGIENRCEQLAELACRNSCHCSFLVDQALFHHLNLRAKPAENRAFAISGLQHVQLAFLDGEFDVLHVLVMLFQNGTDAHQLVIHLCVDRTQGFNGLRSTDTGNNVLTLGIHQILAVELVFTGGGVAGECNTGTAGFSHVAEHHALDVDRRPKQAADVIHLSVLDGTIVVPGLEYGVDALEELVDRVNGKLFTGIALVQALIAGDDFLQILAVKFGVEALSLGILYVLEGALKFVVGNTHHHLAEHLHETAVAVPGKAFVFGLGNQGLDTGGVEPQIEDGIHHAGHRLCCSTANRYEQGILIIPELCPHQGFKLGKVLKHLIPQALGIGSIMGTIIRTRFSADCKARRHGKTNTGHIGEVCTFTAEQLFHLSRPFCLAGAEKIDILGFFLCHT